ncbi:unnamed protein product [Meloidogyne enterolobii]|uniref:Uncharacterized protein n=1 Tax=Meloidogyne enterolobii TaxID=390850 RepID=A0ACB0XQC2_MELEN
MSPTLVYLEVPLRQRWVGTIRGVGNRKSRKSECLKSRNSEIKFFSEIGRKKCRKSEFRPTSAFRLACQDSLQRNSSPHREIYKDTRKRYGDSKFSKNVFELSYNHDHELITKHIHQTYFVVEIRKIFCGIFDFAKNCKKSSKKESEKNGRTESTTPLIDEDYDSDGSKKEEDCNLDLDKVAIFKRVCKVFQKENSNDRVELLRLKGFNELDGQRNNLDLKKLKKDLDNAKPGKPGNTKKEGFSLVRGVKKVLGIGKNNKGKNKDKNKDKQKIKANSIDIEPPRRSFEFQRSESNIADPPRKSLDVTGSIPWITFEENSYHSDNESRQSLDTPLLDHEQNFYKSRELILKIDTHSYDTHYPTLILII